MMGTDVDRGRGYLAVNGHSFQIRFVGEEKAFTSCFIVSFFLKNKETRRSKHII